MSKFTKKEIFNKLNGKKVLKTAINCFTVEDNEQLKKDIIDSLKENNCTIEDFEEDDDKYSIKGYNNFWSKSDLLKEEVGVLKFRSKDYIFTNNNKETCYGDIPTNENIILLENGFVSVRKWIDEENNIFSGMQYTLLI